MKNFTLILLLLPICLQGYTQDLPFAKAQVKTLSDSTFYGRGYVSDGSNKAAEYLAGEFEKIGVQPLSDSYFQPFEMEVNTFPVKTKISCNGKTLVEGYDYLIDPASGSIRGKFKVTSLDSSDLQDASSSISSSRNGKNAFVVDMNGVDSKTEQASFHNFLREVLNQSPVIKLSDDKLMWSVGQQQVENALVQVKTDKFCEDPKKVSLNIQNEETTYKARNVIGKIEGENHDSSLVITAHYDHLGMMGNALFAGASDNASGTAMLLDFAKYYKQHPPKYDLYFIAFAAEEAGLLGSRHFVDNPTFPLNKVKFLINLDLMGSAAEGIAVVNGKSFPDKMEALKAINKSQTHLSRIKLRGQAANSDHYWFSEAGVPAIFIYTIGNAKAYHDVHDVYSGLDFANYWEVFTLLSEFMKTL